MKITVQALASDTDNGTECNAVATSVQAITWLVESTGEDRESYDAWLALHPDDDVWGFVEEHRGDLDTHSWDTVDVEVDLCAQPLPATGVDQVAEALECLRRARELLKAADNKRTLERVNAAISSCRGAARVQEYRALGIQCEEGN